jgi:glutathione synthase/RimK-type ligase-like ATP-grasp enzyme
MPSVAVVTCLKIPDPDHDQELLLGALRQSGLRAELLAWDDPKGDPGAFDLCVLRSCWDYYRDPPRFLAFVADAARRSRLWNPEKILRWNLHKRYLRELENAGLPIIPTVWLDKGASVDLATVMETNSWDDVVVKPAISASSFGTERFQIDRVDEGQRFLDTMLAERDVMVQRYIKDATGMGERAIVWIDGRLTHAVRKFPRFTGDGENVSEALPISKSERAIAQQALSLVEDELLYARVDVMNDEDGKLLVSELELMEPSLFLRRSPAALERFVGAVGRRAAAQDSG